MGLGFRMACHLQLAPMRGLTDYIYRNILHCHFNDIDSAIAPFIATRKSGRITPSFVKDLLPENNQGMPVIPQILSKDADDFVALARALFDLGYQTINWNLGCPFPQVAKKGRGSGLLAYPEKIESFLDQVLPKIPNRLSIKTRLGRFSADESVRLIPLFNAYPLAEVIVHPRTGKQMYEGMPDLESFECYLKQLKHRVVYNGDIITLEGFLALRHKFPDVRRWMIGRGIISNPFLPAILKQGNDQPPQDKITLFKAFHDDLFAAYEEVLYGPSHLMNRMKGFWKFFNKAFKNGPSRSKPIFRATKMTQYHKAVARFFDQEARWIL